MTAIDRPSWAAGPVAHFTAAADAMHALLVRRADKLEGFLEGSAEEAEYGTIADALVAYEQIRWPEGKVAGGKG
jgi:hypothetical protein